MNNQDGNLWLIEDLEPFPDNPVVGQVCVPTTYWAATGRLGLPDELMSEVPARVVEVSVGGRQERIALLGNGFTTAILDDSVPTGDVTLAGCLVWDRYLWTNFRTMLSGRALVTDRLPLTRYSPPPPSAATGWYPVHHEGPTVLHRDGAVPRGQNIVFRALSVLLVPPDESS